MFKQFLDMLPYGIYCTMQLAPDGHVITQDFVKKDVLMKENFANKKNVFFTPNQFGFRYDSENKKPTIRRNRQHLNGLCCLYVDIDLKDCDAAVPPSVEDVLRYSDCHIFGYELPEPTMIVSSGNGIHMYWVINPLSWKKQHKWAIVQNYIYSVFRSFGADSRVSADAVRVLRVPETQNVKGKNVKECKVVSLNKDNRYDLDDICAKYGIETSDKGNTIPLPKKCRKKAYTRQEDEKKNAGRICGTIIPYTGIYSARCKDLETLLVKFWDKPSGGNRENILFLYRYYQCQILQNESDALKATLKLNQKLENKLKENEVIRATASAEKYYKGNQLNWSNSKLVEFLNITDEQARYLKAILTPQVKIERATSRHANKLKAMREVYRASVGVMKADKVFERQCELYRMYTAGTSPEQIMKELEVSKSTYYRDLQTVLTAEWLERYEAVALCVNESEATGTDGVCVPIPKISAPYNYLSPLACPSPAVPGAFSTQLLVVKSRDG